MMPVTSDFLRTLEIRPVLGRDFNISEERSEHMDSLILSYRLWRDLFHSDSDVLNRSVRLGNTSYAIVGVLPREFWLPQTVDGLVVLHFTGGVDDSGTNTSVIGRLNANTTIRQAQAETSTLTENYRNYNHLSSRYRGLIVVPYQDWLVGDIRTNLLLLFGTTGFLFLMVCSNLVGLFLTRLLAREKEIAVRVALGSNMGSLVRQFLVENAVLSSAGISVGIAVAYELLDGLVKLIPFHLPTSQPVALDHTVLAFAGSIFVALVLLFTLVPALITLRLNVYQALRSVGHGGGIRRAHRHLRHILAVGQVAVSMMLVATASLLIQSLYHLRQERLGFNEAGLITFSTPLARDRYSDAASVSRFASAVSERIGASPGVADVGAINLLPLSGGFNLPAEHEDHPDHSIGGTEIRLVTPDYFKVMAIPIKQGRSFLSQDAVGAAPVAIINAELARRWWPDHNALGERVIIGRYEQQDFKEIRDTPREVVGIVSDTKTVNIKEPPRPTIFLPLAQAPNVFVDITGRLDWAVRCENHGGMAEELRRAVAELEPTQNIQQLQTMSEVVALTTAGSRFDAWLFGSFAALALGLAAMGVYGVLSFSVSYRYQEIGTRMAVGASRASILRLFLRQGLLVIASGLIVGLVGALFLTRSLSSLLYAIAPNDPATFLVVAFILLVIGTISSYVPSSRATKIDPIVVLRNE
jgi:putative ABC transport system permease protein